MDDRIAVLDVDEATVGTAMVPLRVGGWSCKSLGLDGDDTLRARFEGPVRRDWIEVTVVAGHPREAVFHRFSRCAVRYRGALSVNTEERRNEVGALVMMVGASVNAMLEASPGVTMAEALGRSRTTERIVLGRESLRDLLAPELTVGGAATAGFVLADVYPSSYLQHAHSDELELILDFRRDEDSRRLLFVVGRRRDDRPGFATSTHLSIAHLSLGAADPPGADAVRAMVAFVLQLHDHEGLEIEFPSVAADVAPLLLAAAPEPDGGGEASNAELNLAINADCDQACAFCSIKETAPAEDGDARVLARLMADLESNRQRGVRLVRINGYDPLAYSRILEVLRHATALGYEEAHVFSPFTRMADAAFCDAVVHALPARRRFHVPVYSTDPEVHDRVVGRRGAHALVMRALDNLLERVGSDAIWIFQVATAGALEGLAQVAIWARERGLVFQPRLPYPSFESRADRYFSASPRMSDVVDAMAPASAARSWVHVEGVVPCVVFHRHVGEPPMRVWLDMLNSQPLAQGTEYGDERFRHRAAEGDHAAFHPATVPCPHASSCALATVCARELLRSYTEAHGLEEIRPVRMKELVERAASGR